MKAIELTEATGPDGLKLVDRPDPRPGPRQVLLRMDAWSLNYRDLMVVRGQYSARLPLPLTPLSDGVGRVVEIGQGVTRVKVGDRVMPTFVQKWLCGTPSEAIFKSALGAGGPGLLAELVVLGDEGLVPAPEYLSDEEAATLPCAALTAWHALVSTGKIQPGNTILTQGTGGVSLFALQMALIAGARVLVTSKSDAKLERAKKLGASETINYQTTPEWDKVARDLTGGTGVDHVIELGGAGTLPRSMKAVRYGGTISLIGVLTGGGEANPMPLLMRNIRLQGIFVGSREMFEAMNRAIELHRLRPVIDRVFPFSDAADAYRHLASAAHFGKICIRR
jgi:NADPH:quinone reductase-like Zn-dependent oxidoreductase